MPPPAVLAAHADWSVAPGKCWIAIAAPGPGCWQVRVEPAGPPGTLLARLRAEAAGAPVALGLDTPLGLPRAFAARHCTGLPDFPAFLDRLAAKPCPLPHFLEVCDTLAQAGPARPFYPRRAQRGMTRLSLALALGLPDADALHRACDRATGARPAGAPLFWTLGANQAGRAAAAMWRDVLLPAWAGPQRPALWPFDGPLLQLLRPGGIALAETYPAEAMRQLGLCMAGSKRRQADRAALAPALRAALAQASCAPDPALSAWLNNGFGTDAAGEDRLDCLLGLLGLLGVVQSRRTGHAPDSPWLRWEGWVLGQTDAATEHASLSFKAVPVHYQPSFRGTT